LKEIIKQAESEGVEGKSKEAENTDFWFKV
jgi:hypothetical protein